MKKLNKKGFTLAELLIVIAIIAILIAIAIPAFSGQLENARLQTDHANLRSAYAAVQVANLEGTELSGTYQTDGTFKTSGSKNVTIKSDKHGEAGSSGCSECVVDCSGYNKGSTITVTYTSGVNSLSAGSTGSP